jgi:hypothetical protein
MAKNFQKLRAGMSDKAKAAGAAEHRRLVALRQEITTLAVVGKPAGRQVRDR